MSSLSYEEVMEQLKSKIGKTVFDQAVKGTVPSLNIRMRTNDNVSFDNDKGYLVMGDKTAERKLNDIGQVKIFFQTIMVAKTILEALRSHQPLAKRDIFYANKVPLPGSSKLQVENQTETDAIIQDIELLTGLLREDMGVTAHERGSVVGDTRIQSGEDIIDWSKQGESAWVIPGNTGRIKFIDNKAAFVLVVEKGTVFTRLNLTRWWKDHNCILIEGAGQAARGVKRLVRRLSVELGLPVYILTDADSYGFGIFLSYKFGSISSAYVSDQLACPKAEYLGFSCSDIYRYQIEEWADPAEDADIKKAESLLKNKWMTDPYWQNELKLFLQCKKKAELETLTRKGFKFLADQYLIDKLRGKPGFER